MQRASAAEAVGVAFVALLLVAVTSLLSAFFVWLFWNWLMPDLFNLPRVSLLQALGLAVLGRALFGGGSSSSSKSK